MENKGTKVKKSDILRSNIFNKSIELFTEKGFDNVKVSDICEELDISTGLFYYYYPSKEAVLLTYTRLADEMLDSLANQLSDTQCSNADKLVMMVVEKFKAFSIVGQKLGNVCMTAFLKHFDDSFMDMSRSAFSHFMHIIDEGQKAGEFRKDIDPYMATSSLRYIISGLALHWSCSQKFIDINEEAEIQTKQFISQIKA